MIIQKSAPIWYYKCDADDGDNNPLNIVTKGGQTEPSLEGDPEEWVSFEKRGASLLLLTGCGW